MRAAAILALLPALATAMRATDVTVVGPDGAAVPDAAVVCEGSEGSPVLTGSDGRAVVPEACLRASCMSGRYLPGNVDLRAALATCRLAEGVRVVVELAAPGCGEHCDVSLRPISPGVEPVHREMQDDPRTGGSAARLPLVPPGSYVVTIFGERFWQCRAHVDLTLVGESSVPAVWRGPALVRGVVLGQADLPVPDMPVRLVRKEEATGTEWRCGTDPYAPDIFTGPDGSFEIAVDPESRDEVEAGSSWDPDGYGTAAVSRAPESLVIRVSRRPR
jgi:hypothetical protein